MRFTTAKALMAATVLATPIIASGEASAAAGQQYSYNYSYSVQGTFSSNAADSLCGAKETVTVDGTYRIHLVTSLSGLTADEVLELWNNEGLFPDGDPAPIQHLDYRESGSFTAYEGDHTYSGTYDNSFIGNTGNMQHFLQTGTFRVRGTSETGSRLTVNSGGPMLSAADGAVWDHEHFHVTGCLPNADTVS
ncbi:MAG: hypothetical protein ACTHK1_00555 [Actinomycetales bacterium]